MASLNTPKNRQGKHTPSHVRAPMQEAEAARRVGGRVTPGSGSGRVKGDARRRGVVRIECKTTSKKSFSVTREMVEKIEAAALACGEVPVVEIEITGGGHRPCKVCVVPSYVLDMIAEQAGQAEQGGKGGS